MIKAVLLDFDGVIIQSELLHRESFLEVLSPWKINVTKKRWYEEFAGTGSRHILDVLIKENKISENVDELVEKRKRIYEQKVKEGKLMETSGIREFLIYLKNKKIKTAIVSGSHRTNVQLALITLNLSMYFDLIVAGDDLKERKPSPVPYLYAAKELGMAVNECIVIEDAPPGCMAARAAKMKLIVVKSPVKVDVGKYDLLIKNFDGSELKKIKETLEN